MSPCEETLAWLKLSRTPRLAIAALASALDRLGSASAVLDASDAYLEAAGISAAARDYLHSDAVAPRRAERRWLEAPDHHLLPLSSPAFPPLLRASSACPVALYVAGRREALGAQQLAVVGSRHPTPQGLENAFELARNIARRGLAVTSGLAQGIDAAAHRGALAAQGTTLAVLGCGADRVYPHTHAGLSHAIRGNGALVSAFPLGTAPRRANFPLRNRLIAAMTLGTLVVEAAQGSGSLLTARSAARAGRPLFAVPGSIVSPQSRGCHQLIKQGAALVEHADDILRKLDFPAFFAGTSHPRHPSREVATRAPGMDKHHKILLDALGFDPADLDTLVVRTGLKPQTVSSMMLILELEGHVQAAPGGRYSRVAGRRAGGER